MQHLPPWLRVVDGGLEIKVRVVPRSSRDRIAGVLGDRLKIQVTGPPVEGAANDCVLDVLTRSAGLPSRSAALKAGASGRSKTVLLETVDPEIVAARLIAVAMPPR
jgi:uncharacterized protein